MPKRSALVLVVTLFTLLAACGGESDPASDDTTTPTETPATETSTGDESAETPPEPRRIGGDRDEHGCYRSAGYRWCARENQCVRSWELARARGFESSQTALDAYCAGP